MLHHADRLTVSLQSLELFVAESGEVLKKVLEKYVDGVTYVASYHHTLY